MHARVCDDGASDEVIVVPPTAGVRSNQFDLQKNTIQSMRGYVRAYVRVCTCV